MKKIRPFLGIETWKSMQIFCLLVGLGVLWYAPFDMVVSAEQISRTISTQTEDEAGLIVLTRYRDMIHIALRADNNPDEVWCIILDESFWRKKLRKIDDGKFFGRIRTDAEHVTVSCQVGEQTSTVYSIHASDITEYPPGMRDFVFTTPISNLARYWNP